MLKTIDLGGGRTLRLSNRISWLYEYKDQFGQDILPTLMPALLGLAKALGAVGKSHGGFDNLNEDDLIELLGSDEATDIGVHFAAFDGFTGILDIAWAMAKTADPTIPEPMEWVRQIEGTDDEEDEMPLVDIITPTLLKLMFTGVMSRKNQTRLQNKAASLQPKKKTKSSKK